jgi:hypothetical protein
MGTRIGCRVSGGGCAVPAVCGVRETGVLRSGATSAGRAAHANGPARPRGNAAGAGTAARVGNAAGTKESTHAGATVAAGNAARPQHPAQAASRKRVFRRTRIEVARRTGQQPRARGEEQRCRRPRADHSRLFSMDRSMAVPRPCGEMRVARSRAGTPRHRVATALSRLSPKK